MDGKQLKNSILQWAIQGKLVPQNPKDEPASKLLERIEASRNESTLSLPKGAKSKKSAPTSRIYRENGVWYEQIGNAEPIDISEDIPFEIPENWAWTRVSQVMDVKGGKRIPLGSSWTKEKTDHIYIRVTDMKNGTIVDRDLRYITNNIYEKIKNYTISKHDLYITVAGTIGAVGDVPEKFDGMNLTENANKLTDIGADKDYIVKCFSSPFVQSQFKALTNQMAQPKLSIRNVLTTLFPLPPLAEQKRIVAKLKQVLPLADEYGAAQEQLDKLNKELPEALKKSILQQAIQGKLVPQNPKDEPAHKLLERITAARSEANQPKGAKSKKSAPTSRIYCENGTWYEQIGNAEPEDLSDEIPFDIPASWVWCRFNSICDIARGGSPRPIQDYLTDSPEGYNWIKIGDTEKGGKYINSTKERIKPEGLTKTRLIHKGDFLLTNSMSFGRPYISNIDGCIHDGWLVISILGNAFVPDYLYYLLSSQYAYRQFCGRVAGAVVKNLNIDKVAESLIPLPPLAEQKRIVTKLEQLFKVL